MTFYINCLQDRAQVPGGPAPAGSQIFGPDPGPRRLRGPHLARLARRQGGLHRRRGQDTERETLLVYLIVCCFD